MSLILRRDLNRILTPDEADNDLVYLQGLAQAAQSTANAAITEIADVALDAATAITNLSNSTNTVIANLQQSSESDNQVAIDLANTKIPLAQKGAPNGVATLDSNSKLLVAQLPEIALIKTFSNISSDAAMIALSAQAGDVCIRTDYSPPRTYMKNEGVSGTASDWTLIVLIYPFTGSGSSHAPGLVPDPGSILGDRRFLNEDGSFSEIKPFIGSGPSHAIGGVPDPGPIIDNKRFLNENGSFSELPIFGASGINHSAGVVPDPGATQGFRRYLREDGWAELSEKRKLFTFQTGLMLSSEIKQFSIPLSASYFLLQLAGSTPARIRIYIDEAHLNVDWFRPTYLDPVGDHGVIGEAITTTVSPKVDFMPSPLGYNQTDNPDTTTNMSPILITNLDSISRDILISIIYTPQEL